MIRVLRQPRSAPRGDDRSAALLVLGTRGLPAGYQDWGKAMRNEHGYIHGASARWRFSLGCVWAATLIRLRAMVNRPAPGTTGGRASVFAGIAAALCLAAYALLRYPELRSDPGTLASVTFFFVVLVGYALIALALSGEDTGHASVASRYGLTGGLVIGGAWFVILAPTNLLKGWVTLPLMIVLLGPACIAALAGRAANDARTGTQAALWSGIVGGLTTFVIWVTATYLRDGRPYVPACSETSTAAAHMTSLPMRSATTLAADSSSSSSSQSPPSPSAHSPPASPSVRPGQPTAPTNSRATSPRRGPTAKMLGEGVGVLPRQRRRAGPASALPHGTDTTSEVDQQVDQFVARAGDDALDRMECPAPHS